MILYYTGRIFQLIGLLAMPSAMWIAHFYRSERGSIGVFVGSIVVFSIGTVLLKVSGKSGSGQ